MQDAADGRLDRLPKKERALLTEEKEKLERILGGVEDMAGLPQALFIVDLKKEHIAVSEAKRLEIPVLAIVDTNCDPEEAAYPIPGNDDAIRAIKLVCTRVAEGVMEGRQERDARLAEAMAEQQFVLETAAAAEREAEKALAAVGEAEEPAAEEEVLPLEQFDDATDDEKFRKR